MNRFSFLLITLISFTSCLNLSEIQTIVTPKTDETINSKTLGILKKQLETRFQKTEFRDSKISISEDGKSLKVIAKIEEDNPRSIERYHSLFESYSLDLWDMYRTNDEEVISFFNETPFSENFLSKFTINENEYERSVLGSCNDEKFLQLILDSLNLLSKKSYPNFLFLWSLEKINRYSNIDGYKLYLINTKGSSSPPITEQNIIDINVGSSNSTGEPEIYFKMNETGAKIWEDMTREAANDNNREIAIVINDRVFSAPSVRSEILGGLSSITGDFSEEEALDLAFKIGLGRMNYTLEIIDETTIKQE